MGRHPRPGRLAASLVGAALFVVGGASLAGNVVTGSDAGTVAAPVVIPTAVQPVGARLDPPTSTRTRRSDPPRYGVTMSVRLLDGQRPLAQRPLAQRTVELSAGGRRCAALTDAGGTASCTVTGLGRPPTSWTAVFAGSGPFQAATVATPLVVGGGGR